MKKIISILLLICTMTLCLASCGDNNNNDDNLDVIPEKNAAEKVEDLIASISDAASCYNAAKAYNELTFEEKKNVSNSDALKNSMITYVNDKRIEEYLMEYQAQKASDECHNFYRDALLNVSSYTVNAQTTTVFYDNKTDTYFLFIVIDYSAQNKMGGYNRSETQDTFVWTNNDWKDTYYVYDTDTELDVIWAMKNREYSVYRNYTFAFSPD